MVDFSKIFNIVFVSVCAGLLLLLLASVIAVAAKGKRKCGAVDVLLRIVSSLALVASAVMVVCSILTMLNTVDGSMCIVAAQEGDVATAWLVMGGEITELPIPELFVALSTVIGFGLSAVLFILSLTALIVDCLVANKKDGNNRKKQSKEPVAKKTPEQIKREKELERIRRIGESAVRKTSSVASAEKTEKSEAPVAENKVEQNAQETLGQDAAEEQSDFDWRAPEQKQEQTGFVGIKDDEQDSFDTFDSFDDEPAQQSEDQSQGVADEDYGEEVVEEAAEEQAYDAAEESEEIFYDDDEAYTLDDAETYAEQGEADEVYDGDAQKNFDAYDEPIAEESEQAYGEQSVDTTSEVENPYQSVENTVDESIDIEPDRGIYIPKIRTVTPQQSEVKKAGAKAAKKPAAKKATSAKTAKPKKSGGGQKPSVATNIPPEKKLPVTRRYVILDRHNAVNMFGEYLKERNQAEKDKLKSSINTIIIE
ncbi:MAG: hypothetical protein K2O04_05545 [Clostridiales bacterium]|nr:hypothetical protein [Clostridiales bacterium]